MTHANLSMYELLRILKEECDTFAGVKYTDENLYEFQRCIDFSGRFQMLFGRDEMLLAALAVGAEAGVGSTFNFFPRLYRGILDAWAAGDIAKAHEYQELAHRCIIFIGRYGMPSQKLFMKFAGLDIGPMRLPAPRLSSERELEFRRGVSAAGLDPWLG
jgi:N-acetylneuraminate lyase